MSETAGTVALRVVSVLDLPRLRDADGVPAVYRRGETDFMREGACRAYDPRLFDTATHHGETALNGSVVIGGKRMSKRAQVDKARRVCKTCRVLGKCLAFVLKYPQPTGIWAGVLPDEAPRKTERPARPGRS